MFNTRFFVFALMLVALIGTLQSLFNFEMLLYVGQQWSWLAAFFLAILASLVVTWLLTWGVGRMIVSFRLGRNRLKMPGARRYVAQGQ